MRRFCRRWALALLGGLAWASAGQASEYWVVDLGTLGGTHSAALGINNRSQVVGWSQDAQGRTQAFLWARGTMRGLGFLTNRWSNSVATAINDRGEITGYSSVSPTNEHAFFWASNQMVSLGTLGGPSSRGRALNEAGDIAGWSQIATNFPSVMDPKSFCWRSNQMIYIPTYISTHFGEAYGVNEKGVVCGETATYFANSAIPWAYLWEDKNTNNTYDEGELIMLGSLGVSFTTGSGSGARAINDRDQVVGWSYITNNASLWHAFLVTASNGQWFVSPSNFWGNTTNLLMRDLGALDTPAQRSHANAINNQSWIVGVSSTLSGTNQAFLWRNGVMTNLNHLIPPNAGWLLTEATGINDHNEIVGSGWHQGRRKAFLLTPTGRITQFQPLWQTNHWLITNQWDEVSTQSAVVISGHRIEWAGVWGRNPQTAHVYAVEYCDDLRQTSSWQTVVPTSRWPIADNYWTEPADAAVSSRFFRIRAVPETP